MQIYSCVAGSKSLIIAGVMLLGTAVLAQNSGTTTSPMELLKAVPKVKLEDPPAAPAPAAPAPYYPPRGQAPYIAPVEPALTPYAGNTTVAPRPAAPASEPDYLNYGGPVAPPPGMPPAVASTPQPFVGPTPRPVLGPEDVDRRQPKKRGIVRGLLNVLPFVGDDDEAPTPIPSAGMRGDIAPPPGMPTRDESIYRGYNATPGSTDNLLQPTPPAVGRGNLPPDPEPSSPVLSPDSSPDAPLNLDEMATPATPGSSGPVLTVKREEPEGTSGTKSTEPVVPAVATDDGEATGSSSASPPIMTPTPRAVATPRPTPENIVIAPGEKSPSRASEDDESAPITVEDSHPAPTPAAADTPVPDPTPEPVAEATPAVPDEVTSLSIVQADLGMPNPVYEQNATILGEFQQGVRSARADNFAEAARVFREYLDNHPSSGLAPRAGYLAIVFEKNNATARDTLKKLKELYPDSHYVKDAVKRRAELDGGATADASTAAEPVASDETPRAKADRLEKELTIAIGDSAKEPGIRRELGETYLELEEFDRAWEILRPAVDQVSGQPEEGKVLLLLARCQMARKDTVRALGIVENVESRYPETITESAPASWIAGLVYESGGKYARARSIYADIRLKWPDSREAGWASARLSDLAAVGR